jgi:UDP-N-acetylglucosamine transferase subunit ALG13
VTDPATPRYAADAPPSPRRVFVTVGSDHHRFDRLVGWVDGWARTRGLGADDVLIQYGTATAPAVAAGVPFVDHDTLLHLMAVADVVVCQGGPMSIVEARAQGRRPVVVARTAALDEVVDDHQHAFCRRVAADGWIDLAETADELETALDRALADPASMRLEAADPEHAATVAASVARFARVADDVLAYRWRAIHRDPTVLVLGGFGRSGSTLLERAISTVPGVTGLGEVVHLWERGLTENQRCGCGKPFAKCPFWTHVGLHAFGGWASVDRAAALADRRDVVRTRHIGALLTGLESPARRLRRLRLVRRLDALYEAAAIESDAQVLVDSSKHPAWAFALRSSRADIRCVLVVRDPRGVAYSWGKAVVRPEITDREQLMPRYRPAVAAAQWAMYDLLFRLLRLARVPTHVVRYEDLVDDPRRTVAGVLRFAGMPVDESSLAALRPGSVTLDVDHTVAGNPMRFTTGEVPLRRDEEWRDRMPKRARAVVSAVTAPLRARYGYR